MEMGSREKRWLGEEERVRRERSKSNFDTSLWIYSSRRKKDFRNGAEKNRRIRANSKF